MFNPIKGKQGKQKTMPKGDKAEKNWARVEAAKNYQQRNKDSNEKAKANYGYSRSMSSM